MKVNANDSERQKQITNIVAVFDHGMLIIQQSLLSTIDSRLREIEYSAQNEWNAIFLKYDEVIWMPLELLLPQNVVNKLFSEKEKSFDEMVLNQLHPGIYEFKSWYKTMLKEISDLCMSSIKKQEDKMETDIASLCKLYNLNLDLDRVFHYGYNRGIIDCCVDPFETIWYLRIDSILSSIPKRKIRYDLVEIASSLKESMRMSLEMTHIAILRNTEERVSSIRNDVYKTLMNEIEKHLQNEESSDNVSCKYHD